MLPDLPALANLLMPAARAEPAPLRALVLNLPAQLAQAPVPVSLAGVVAESPVPGQLRIATPLGEIQLRAPSDIPVGRAVTIVTRPTMPTEVFLLPTAGSAAPPNTAPAATPKLLPSSSPVVGAAPAADAANHPLPAPTGAPANAVTNPFSNRAPVANANVAGANIAALVPAATASAAPPPPVATIDTARSPPLAARVPPPTPVPMLSPTSLLATLTAGAMPERIGTSAYVARPASPAPPSELLALLTDLRRLVAARDPRLADRLLRRLPTPDRAGVIAMLTLPVAAERAALPIWLGRDIARLVIEDADEKKVDLLDRIGSSLARVEERIDERDERPWQWRQLPLLDNGQIVPLAIGVAREHGRAEPDAKGRRAPGRFFAFAVEIALNTLGHTRIEATYGQRRLDLVVQTETAIETEGREQVVAAVAQVCEEFGLGGSCRFEPYRDAAIAAVKV